MRIALLVPGLAHRPGELCLPHVEDAVRALAERHEVDVYVLEYPAFAGSWTHGRAQVYAFGANNARRRLGLLASVPRALWSAHRTRPYDVVHALWAGLPGGLGALCARALRRPLVVSLLGTELRAWADDSAASWRGRLLVAASLRAADSLTVGSEWLRHRLAEPHRAAARVVPLGVDPMRFQPGSVRRGHTLLQLGRLEPDKQPLEVLRAFQHAAPPNASLRFVGDGSLRTALLRAIDVGGLGDRVVVAGPCAPGAVADELRGADRLILASLWESQGRVVAEALATGLPVIATPVGTAADLPSELVTLAADARPEVLGVAIASSLADVGHAERVHAGGPRWVEANASLAGTVRGFEEAWTRAGAG